VQNYIQTALVSFSFHFFFWSLSALFVAISEKPRIFTTKGKKKSRLQISDGYFHFINELFIIQIVRLMKRYCLWHLFFAPSVPCEKKALL
jgi:hypothetical protein